MSEKIPEEEIDEMIALANRVLIAEEAGASQTAAKRFTAMTVRVPIPQATRLLEFRRSVWECERDENLSQVFA